MAEINMSVSWGSLTLRLHKIQHILEAAAHVSEDKDPRNEIVHTLVTLAIEHVEDIEEHIQDLRAFYDVKKDPAHASHTEAEGHMLTLS